MITTAKKNTEQQEEFIDYCLKVITAKYPQKKVKALCFPPGIGKTTTLKKLIKRVLNIDTMPGMIVVTDLVDALKELAEGHESEVALLQQENLGLEMQTQKSKKILFMTTQRYFAMSAEEISAFLPWDGGRRSKIIIDEKAQTLTQTNINLKNLNDIDTALVNGIDNLYPDDKAWCISEWRNFRQHLETVMDTYETMCKGRLEVWHKDSRCCITANDERFYAFLEKYSAELKRKNQLFFSDLKAIHQIITDGAIFHCQKRGNKKSASSGEKYDKSFSVIRDNSSTLNQFKTADVFILDATADITPDYQFPYIEIIKDKKFDTDLSNLTIEIIDVQTSKTAIATNTAKAKGYIAGIKSIIAKEAVNHKTAIFTYSEIENQFSSLGMTGHFGRLHGSNEYRQCDCIAHVGLNRAPHINYFLLDAMVSPYNDLEEIKKLPPLEQIPRLDNWLKPNGLIAKGETMMKSLLVDFEQNIFRSAIRNRTGTPVKILLFCDCRTFSSFILRMRGRYTPLGATIIETKHPIFSAVKAQNRNKDTNTKKILYWISAHDDGYIFKTKELYQDTGLDNKKVSKVREKNSGIDNMFHQMETGKKGYYKIDKSLIPK